MRGWPFALLSDALLAPSGRGSGRGPVETELTDLLDAIYADPARSVARYDRAAELFAALLRRRGADRPWALVLEDVHEADAPSLEVLLQLAHEGAVPRALVVLTMRPVPYRPELAAVVAAWTRAGARYLELRPLSARATVELAENLVGGPVGPSLRGTLATTGGNPRLVADVVRTARAAGALVTTDGVLDSTGVRWLTPLDEVVRRRVEYLGPEVLALLGQASVLGTSFVIADLASLAGDPVARLLAHPAARPGRRGGPGTRRPAGVRARPRAGRALQRAGTGAAARPARPRRVGPAAGRCAVADRLGPPRARALSRPAA